MKIKVLITIATCLSLYANAQKLNIESKTNIRNYLFNSFNLSFPQIESHIYIFQNIRCSSCAEDYFEYILKYENNSRKKIIIQTGPIKSGYVDKLKQLPNTYYVVDSNLSFQNYKVMFANDLFLKVENNKISKYFFFTEKNIKKVSKYYK